MTTTINLLVLKLEGVDISNYVSPTLQFVLCLDYNFVIYYVE